ncbi:MAG: recombination mediator RecR [bacterium]|nr:recombination mediator RecR [bacterium]
MSLLPKSIQNLIDELSKLPGIGPKSASRLAFYLLKQSTIDLESFSSTVGNLKKDIVFCDTCHNMTEKNPCIFCSDNKRDRNLICVVEDPLDVVAMDQIEGYDGLFHVLGGVISPIDGVGPEDLKVKELLVRLQSTTEPKEVIFATNPSLEGEATAMYIARLLKNPKFDKVKITRIGRGLPMGGDLEYADEYTLSKALEGRREF